MREKLKVHDGDTPGKVIEVKLEYPKPKVKTMSKTLHLVLTGKWYDKIASGEKTSEYRKCSNYWNKRLGGIDTRLGHVYDMLGISYKHKKEYYSVVFHRGYTNKTMEFAIVSIDIITGKPNDLGLFQCWEIKLGQRITKGGDNEQ